MKEKEKRIEDSRKTRKTSFLSRAKTYSRLQNRNYKCTHRDISFCMCSLVHHRHVKIQSMKSTPKTHISSRTQKRFCAMREFHVYNDERRSVCRN